MPTTRKKNIRKTRRKPLQDSSNVVVVMHTREKETLFPEKLKMANEMLGNTKLLDS
jgi:hypothetical protein